MKYNPPKIYTAVLLATYSLLELIKVVLHSILLIFSCLAPLVYFPDLVQTTATENSKTHGSLKKKKFRKRKTKFSQTNFSWGDAHSEVTVARVKLNRLKELKTRKLNHQTRARSMIAKYRNKDHELVTAMATTEDIARQTTIHTVQTLQKLRHLSNTVRRLHALIDTQREINNKCIDKYAKVYTTSNALAADLSSAAARSYIQRQKKLIDVVVILHNKTTRKRNGLSNFCDAIC